MWNPLSWVMEAAAIIAIVFTQGGVSLQYFAPFNFSLPIEYKYIEYWKEKQGNALCYL